MEPFKSIYLLSCDLWPTSSFNTSRK